MLAYVETGEAWQDVNGLHKERGDKWTENKADRSGLQGRREAKGLWRQPGFQRKMGPGAGGDEESSETCQGTENRERAMYGAQDNMPGISP